MLTPARMIVTLGVIAIISFICGPLFLVLTIDVPLFEKRYDDACTIGNVCNINFQIEAKIRGDIRIKYKLTNFHQNHNQFMKSRNIDQLRGKYVDFSDMYECKPLRSRDDSESESDWILPCGLSAVSIFNDTFTIKSEDPGFSETGITDQYEVDSIYKPLNSKYATGNKWLENNTLFPGAQTNEHFIEWMRASATPTIVKTYSICRSCELQTGNFTIQIKNNYPASFFDGKKYIILEKDSLLGLKNTFLGILFVVIAIFCTICLILILLLKIFYPRKLGDQAIINEMIERNKALAFPH
ncbi:hypothetical protein TVAG_155710 [Trichomonas vaginalis G3]|uniref:Uncharacterized protein n=1 Tax=Trichomonas vaginalis (strain ATCC PRA-98 / G3) TaxID=412133 RepID=A2FZC4_TRIV3|nr:aminophospholipid transmembrane transporter protein [Trichomonas vaginalis G3]EAX89750.1 hypothetical protein TVAG_155710 [Trichomonas vaginalis G3]KAI5551036.1 aminophospholipid transmembrane transporter protein [Trichomonas vaginalis G3]|eukprot:XP_001302680.1 hypothetical protein [Trichomonas vaginalis G3]